MYYLFLVFCDILVQSKGCVKGVLRVKEEVEMVVYVCNHHH